MHPPRRDSGEDDWIWGREKSGEFTIKSAYNLICQIDEVPVSTIWTTIWKWGGPNRIRHFLWLAAKDRLLTNATRKRRGMCQEAKCEFCLIGEETVSHVLQRGRRIEVSWKAGPEEWFTLNSDGSVLGHRGRSAAGGLIRDSSGNCVQAFTMNLGVCTITRAEICGVLEGVRRAWEAGYRKLEIQMDSKVAVEILLNANLATSPQFTLETLEFRDWLQRDWVVKVKHVYREANHAADYLANLGHNTTRGSHEVDCSDCNLAYFIRYDCMGISEPRVIN
ncbi:Putative ribonuclease H protein At1g65750 [Linum perenne]